MEIKLPDLISFVILVTYKTLLALTTAQWQSSTVGAPHLGLRRGLGLNKSLKPNTLKTFSVFIPTANLLCHF